MNGHQKKTWCKYITITIIMEYINIVIYSDWFYVRIFILVFTIFNIWSDINYIHIYNKLGFTFPSTLSGDNEDTDDISK